MEACGYSVKSGREGRSRESPFLSPRKKKGGVSGGRHERSKGPDREPGARMRSAPDRTSCKYFLQARRAVYQPTSTTAPRSQSGEISKCRASPQSAREGE